MCQPSFTSLLVDNFRSCPACQNKETFQNALKGWKVEWNSAALKHSSWASLFLIVASWKCTNSQWFCFIYLFFLPFYEIIMPCTKICAGIMTNGLNYIEICLTLQNIKLVLILPKGMYCTCFDIYQTVLFKIC